MHTVKYLLVLLYLLGTGNVSAQQVNLVTEGRIEFEKKLNLYSQFNDDDSWTAEFKKRIPQFKLTYFDLTFSANKTLYKLEVYT